MNVHASRRISRSGRKKSKIQKVDLEMNENNIIKTIDGLHSALHTHQKRNAHLRSMRNIHNAHEVVTAKFLLSKFRQLKCAVNCGPGDTSCSMATRSRRRSSRSSAASVGWIMVRMDLLAYYK